MTDRALSQYHHSVGSIVMAMLGIMCVFALGSAIPLPGLERAFLDNLLAQGDNARFSLLTIGSSSVLTVFALGQILTLLVPNVERQPAFAISARVFVILIACLQAYSIFLAMGNVRAMLDDNASPFAIMGSLVGGAALVFFLSERIRLPLLTLGFWIVWLAGSFASMPNTLWTIFTSLRTGSTSPFELFLVIFYSTASIGICLFATRLLVQTTALGTDAAGERPWNLMSIVVWPPFLALIAAQYIAPAVSLIFYASMSNGLINTGSWISHIFMAWVAALVPIFVWLFWRRFQLCGILVSPFASMFLAGTQVAVVIGGIVLGRHLTVPLLDAGTTWVVIAAVWFAIMDAVQTKPEAGASA